MTPRKHKEKRGRQTHFGENGNLQTKKKLHFTDVPEIPKAYPIVQDWWQCKNCGRKIPSPLAFCSTKCKNEYTIKNPVGKRL